MKQLDNLRYDTISTLRSNKKQPNENAIYSINIIQIRVALLK